MICKGTRPDGTPCNATDEYVSSETGLCWSCAAPESKALVPVAETVLMADPAVTTLYEALPPKAQAFLPAYMEDTTILGAADACGISRTSHYYWLENTAGYREVFEVAQREVVDHWRRHLADKAKNGLVERMYDADGNLKHTRIREDAALLKMHMMAVDPEMYNPEKSRDNNVVIILNERVEGGWAADQEAQEVVRIEVPEAIPDEDDE